MRCDCGCAVAVVLRRRRNLEAKGQKVKNLIVASVLLLMMLSSFGCDSPEHSSKLADGIYGVIAFEDQLSALPSAKAGQCVIEFSPRFVKDSVGEPSEWFLLDLKSFAALELTEPPADLGDKIELAFTRKTQKALTELSADFIGKRVAIVIGGEVVTAHKVREKIEMGQLQISC